MDILVMQSLKKILRFFFGISLLVMMTACPGEDTDCYDFGSIATVEDLTLLLPEQPVYNQGDEIVLSLTLPAVNDFYGQEMDLYAATGDDFARLVVNFDQLFTGNQLTFIKGNQSDFPNWFDLAYNSETGDYELEIEITLNKVGNYSFVTNDSVTIQGEAYCNRFRIDTNVKWSLDHFVEFTVIE